MQTNYCLLATRVQEIKCFPLVSLTDWPLVDTHLRSGICTCAYFDVDQLSERATDLTWKWKGSLFCMRLLRFWTDSEPVHKGSGSAKCKKHETTSNPNVRPGSSSSRHCEVMHMCICTDNRPFWLNRLSSELQVDSGADGRNTPTELSRQLPFNFQMKAERFALYIKEAGLTGRSHGAQLAFPLFP